MKVGVPVRTTVIWVGLVLATCLTLWLGSGHPTAQQGMRLTVASAIPVAFLKIYFIGSEFMELRVAPALLRGAFTAWVVAVGATTTTLYLLQPGAAQPVTISRLMVPSCDGAHKRHQGQHWLGRVIAPKFNLK